MKLYGLVGVSGSGKSHHATRIANGLGAELIIDDGLSIYRGQAIAGFSAKFEMNKISAIRRAVFVDDIHCEKVREAITAHPDSTVLVLGTSQKMIRTITERLGLKGEIDWINIRDVSDAENISAATAFRAQGMHAIPVAQSKLVEPFVPKFFRYILGGAKSRRQNGPQETHTIVYPLFSNGAIFVHPRVVRDSIDYLIRKDRHPFTLKTVHCDTRTTMDIHIHVYAAWQQDMRACADCLLLEIRAYLRDYLGFPYARLFLHIDSICPPHEPMLSNSTFRSSPNNP